MPKIQYIFENTEDFTVTVIIPNADDLQLDKGEMTVFFNVPIPIFVFSPSALIPPGTYLF